MKKIKKGEKRVPHLRMYEAILTLETVEEAVRFFSDLCSLTELRAIEQRFQVASMLNEGEIYNTILDKTGASSATISRVNRSLNYGENGYDIVFERLLRKGIN